MLTSILPVDLPSGTPELKGNCRCYCTHGQQRQTFSQFFTFCGNAKLQQVPPSCWVSETPTACAGHQRQLHRQMSIHHRKSFRQVQEWDCKIHRIFSTTTSSCPSLYTLTVVSSSSISSVSNFCVFPEEGSEALSDL